VGLIILLPLIYGVAKRLGHSLVAIALPAAGGLAIMHAVVPPHPGPVAAAALLGVSLGWVTIMGLACGLPAWFLGAYVFGKRIGDRMHVEVPEALFAGAQAATGGPSSRGETTRSGSTGSRSAGRAEVAGGAADRDPDDASGRASGEPAMPSLGTVIGIIVLPLALILLNTGAAATLEEGTTLRTVLTFIGDPFIALTVAVLAAFYVFGIRRGVTRGNIETAASASLGPVAMVILVTGAGGMFGRVLVTSGVGDALADTLSGTGLPVLVRAHHRRRTAGLPGLGDRGDRDDERHRRTARRERRSQPAPARARRHRDRGWRDGALARQRLRLLAGQPYLNLDVPQTLKTWTVMETLLGGIVFVIALVISVILGAAGT
jgi:GntP family gluconate:H+ symporter